MPGLPSWLVLSRSAADGVKVATPPAAFVTFHAPVQTYKVRLLLISSVCSAIEPLDTPVRLNTPESVVKVMVQARPSPAGNGVKPIYCLAFHVALSSRVTQVALSSRVTQVALSSRVTQVAFIGGGCCVDGVYVIMSTPPKTRGT